MLMFVVDCHRKLKYFVIEIIFMSFIIEVYFIQNHNAIILRSVKIFLILSSWILIGLSLMHESLRLLNGKLHFLLLMFKNT